MDDRGASTVGVETLVLGSQEDSLRKRGMMAVFQGKQQIRGALIAALECSFYVAPEDPGLTYDEILTIGARLGIQQKEVNDVLSEVTNSFLGRYPVGKLLPKKNCDLAEWSVFTVSEDSDFRNIRAFDAVYSEWRSACCASGGDQVRLNRCALVNRAVNDGIPRLAIQAAISILVFCEVFVENDGVLMPTSVHGDITLPSENISTEIMQQRTFRPVRRVAYPLVQDVIAQRSNK